MSRNWAVVQFPGSNCDEDALRAIQKLDGVTATYHWHEERIPNGKYEVILLPGGFSFGDYLRAGAIAKLSAAVDSLSDAIDAGAHVMGICNGFQILLESRLLPGFLQVNQNLKFISDLVEVEVREAAFPWINESDRAHKFQFPIAHRFGNYQPLKIDSTEIRPVLKYTTNPNGSFEDIAGIYRKHGKGSIFGLMPHPERASFDALRLSSGKAFWKNAWENLR